MIGLSKRECEQWIDVGPEPCHCPDGPCSEHPCEKPAIAKIDVCGRWLWVCSEHLDQWDEERRLKAC